MKSMSWGRFAAMIATSTFIMFFLMYQLVYGWEHALFSLTRLVSSFVMGCVMTAVMLAFMWKMYPNRRANYGVLGLAAGLFLAGLGLVRSQATVDDVAYMRAMIPHHSIAILTSGRAQIEDPRVRKLADAIIETQKREISEMNQLIADLDKE